MEDQPAAGHRALERVGVAQVARHDLDVQFRDAAARPHQRAHVLAALQQQARHVPAEESRSARDERGFHAGCVPA